MKSSLGGLHLALSLLLLLSLERTIAQNDDRMYLYNVQHYDLSIRFDDASKTFVGEVAVSARVINPFRQFVLSASNQTLLIDSVLYRNTRMPFSHEGDHVIIELPSLLQVPDSLKVHVYYHGTSKFQGQFDDGGVLIDRVHGSLRIATSSEPNFARTWWPCKDVPSDKATARISITVPRNLTAVSNGILKNVECRDEFCTYHWETNYPIATYLISATAAVYRHFSDTYTGLDGKQMKIDYYVFPEDDEKAKADLQDVPKILRFFSGKFCEYPFINEKFGFVEVNGNLTMENQTICSIEDRLITGNRLSENTIVHEIAHHWWGNLLTPANWRHTWLNEGFATYAEALYLEDTKGPDTYRKYIDQIMSVKNGLFAGSVLGRSDTSFWDSFAPRVYQKGAMVLHMLRGLVGDTAFFTIMRNYLINPKLRYGSVQTKDFIQECERVYEKKLDWFFDQWVTAYTDSIDRPEIEYSWTSTSSSNGYDVVLDLAQTTSNVLLYRLPLTVSAITPHSVHTVQVIDSLTAQRFNFSVLEKPRSLEIDPENNIFKVLKEKKGG